MRRRRRRSRTDHPNVSETNGACIWMCRLIGQGDDTPGAGATRSNWWCGVQSNFITLCSNWYSGIKGVACIIIIVVLLPAYIIILPPMALLLCCCWWCWQILIWPLFVSYYRIQLFYSVVTWHPLPLHLRLLRPCSAQLREYYMGCWWNLQV